jgi:hypothetical protein
MGNVQVRLVRKLAERIDGVDLSRRFAGQVFSLPADQARLLIAEQWAELHSSSASPPAYLTATPSSAACLPPGPQPPSGPAARRQHRKER